MKERIIEVVQYDSRWPLLFEEEVKSLSALPGFNSCIFHHIGSTSVEGLAAKPIIDILVAAEDLKKFDEYSESLSTKGYKAKGEFGIPGRRYFQKGGDNRTHQIHVFEKNSHHIAEHLAFRDYLRKYPDIAKAYGDLKKEIVKTCNNDISKYSADKHDFITYYLALAMQEFHGK